MQAESKTIPGFDRRYGNHNFLDLPFYEVECNLPKNFQVAINSYLGRWICTAVGCSGPISALPEKIRSILRKNNVCQEDEATDF